ncbi:MAG: DUF4007 family protein [Lachnospiraceae bacterium]|nr:DUF4007 family protein [Lachnospiraceae bacterium]
MSVKYKIKGHETFAIREGWLNKGIAAVYDNPKVFQQNSGADALGVGTNMAKAIRYWMRTAGLLENRKDGVYLTELGKLIYEKDCYMEDRMTLWIIHSNIAANKELATVWYLFFNAGTLFNTSALKEFTKDILYVEITRMLELYTEKEELSVRSISDDCNVLLHMYTDRKEENDDPEEKRKSPFAELGLLKREGKHYKKTTPKLNHLHPSIFWYVLKNMFMESRELNIKNIIEDENSPGRLMHLGRIEVNHYLDILEEEDIITVNRTAGLDMVYEKKKVDSLEILRQYYSTGRRINNEQHDYHR